MEKTAKRISVSLTKEDLRELQTLMDMFEESQVSVMRRGLHNLYRECTDVRSADDVKKLWEKKYVR